jgi:hypothetical protein
LVAPGEVGKHNPKPGDQGIRATQFGPLAASDGNLQAPASNTRAGSTHAEQRQAYLDSLKP